MTEPVADLSSPEPDPQQPSVYDTWRERLKKAFAPVIAVGVFLLKFGAILIKLKFLTVVGTMGVSIAAYALLWGWKFAVGFVLLIFVHEMGHAVMLRHRGIKAGLPVFLPFLGAFISMKSQPASVIRGGRVGSGRARGRHGRSVRRLVGRQRPRLAAAGQPGLYGLPAEPVQPFARAAALRGPGGRRAAPGHLGARPDRPGAVRSRPAQPDHSHHHLARRLRAVATLA